MAIVQIVMMDLQWGRENALKLDLYQIVYTSRIMNALNAPIDIIYFSSNVRKFLPSVTSMNMLQANAWVAMRTIHYRMDNVL